MISVKRFVFLEKQARHALKAGDMATIDLINRDPEIISANVILIVRDGKLYCGVRSEVMVSDKPQKEGDS